MNRPVFSHQSAKADASGRDPLRPIPHDCLCGGTRAESELREKCGFTLIELLVVISLMALLMSLVVPPMVSFLSATNVTQGAIQISDQISMARQIASARNCSIQVRLIKLAKISPKGYTGLQIWLSGANMVSVGKMITLPQGVAISEDPTQLSKILPLLATGTMPTGGVAAGAPYVAFSVRPAGTVVTAVPVSSRKDLFLTVVPSRLADATTVVGNFSTIQINPDSGAPSIFRP